MYSRLSPAEGPGCGRRRELALEESRLLGGAVSRPEEDAHPHHSLT